METRVGRRILSGLLIIALSITMLFVDCSTADARTFPTTEDGKFSYYVSDDFAFVAIIEYLGTEESVIIPETIEGVKVDRLYSQAFMGKPIRSVEGKSIEIIGGEAFKNCTNLEEVNFPNVRRFTVGISFDDINPMPSSKFQFANCTSLKELNFPKLAFANEFAFSGCTNLQTIMLPSFGADEEITSYIHITTFTKESTKEDAIKNPQSRIENIYIPCKAINSQALMWDKDSIDNVKPYIQRILHQYGSWIIKNQPTCSIMGQKERVCALCQNVDTEQIPIDSTAHNYGEWTTTKNPTCSTVGEKERVCVDCNNKDVTEIPIDSTAHSFTNYIYNNDAKVGVDGTETAICDNGCGATDTRTKYGTALEDSGSSGGGSWIPSMQYPNISEGDGYTTSLSDRGRKVTITIDEDYELVDVSLNGESKGIVTELSGLKTGDEVIITVISKVEKIQQELKKANWRNFLARSSQVKMKNGKKAVKITIVNQTGIDFDGVEVFRSMKKDSGYGKKPIFTTKTYKYYNTAVKKGNRYYYKARGYIEYDGVKYYSDWSAKAWRTVK